MKTHFETVIAGQDAEYAGQAAAAVFREIDRIETLFNRFDPSSEISRINRLRPGDALIIGVETYECLTAAERVRVDTGGAFDINIRALQFSGPLQEPARASKNLAPLPPSKRAEARGFELINLSSSFEIRRPPEKDGGRNSLGFDLGGIGKGYALDLALAVLSDWGIGNALIHSGTSTAIAIGSPNDSDADNKRRSDGTEGGGWPVGVGGAKPFPGYPGRVRLKDRALSGSGTEVKGQHILDPRTGLPACGHPAAWASHPSATESDALSTAFMVMTGEAVEEYVRLHPDVWALVVAADGTCRVINPDLLPAQ